MKLKINFEVVFHILSDLGNQVNPIHKDFFKEIFAYIPFVPIEFAHYLLMEIITF
ncbi:hypothetical protein FVB9532_02505 [Mesonia oceanica]|uniref:Uncharacterized protein n=1 Tax=Mesonia oceanica TaxID=2687242 RepID=A0AC61YCR7_9FLAO|nr:MULTISPECIES: hypothetical protein [Mesonia]VVV01220.1 hypothetical protein FVB9532_02505 [Mesonia oceanica]